MLSMFEAKTVVLFIVTAVAEIVGCYLPLLWLKNLAPVWVLIPAALSLALFVWLLSLHPFASGRVYAAYGGIYVATALGWLWLVDGIRPTIWDTVGVAVVLIGMALIVFGPRYA
jgi:small multidrug resistance family-3 protein